MTTLNTSQVAALFNRTAMTIFLWRSGSGVPSPIPHKVVTSPGGRNRVTFDEAKVLPWGKKHGLLDDSKKAVPKLSKAEKEVAAAVKDTGKKTAARTAPALAAKSKAATAAPKAASSAPKAKTGTRPRKPG